MIVENTGFLIEVRHPLKGIMASHIGRPSLDQRCPIIRRISLVEHPLEHGIGICFGAVRSQRGVVVHPGEDDDLGAAVIAKEQAEAPVAELCPKPVLSGGAQCAALPILGSSRIAGNCLEHQGSHSRQYLGVSGPSPAMRVSCPSLLDGCGQLFQLIEQQRVRVNGPTVDDDHESERNRSVDFLIQVDPDMLG